MCLSSVLLGFEVHFTAQVNELLYRGSYTSGHFI